MRKILCTLLLLLLGTFTALASPEALDLSTMTYEELQALRDAALTALIPLETVAEDGAVLFDDYGFVVTYHGCRMDGRDMVLDLTFKYGRSPLVKDQLGRVLMCDDNLYLNGWYVYLEIDNEKFFSLGETRKVEGRIFEVDTIGVSSESDVETMEFIWKLTETGIGLPPVISKSRMEMMIFRRSLSESAEIDLSAMSGAELRRLVDDVRRAMIPYENPAKEDEVVFDDQGVKVALMNWRMDDDKIRFDSIIENATTDSLRVRLAETTVNGWPNNMSFYGYIDPGKKAMGNNYIKSLGKSGIATMQDFKSVSLKVVVEKDGKVFAESDVITLNFAYEPLEGEDAADQPIRISAAGLIDEYDKNVVAADMKFSGRPLRVTGTVRRFDKSFDGSYTLTLGTDSLTVYNISCAFSSDVASQLARLSKGDKVAVTGICQGAYSIMIRMDDCVFATDD